MRIVALWILLFKHRNNEAPAPWMVVHGTGAV
jgi:hypothetical protein